jgi:uncharacterized membrane protein YgdD (TMEM256/DUF423 family)
LTYAAWAFSIGIVLFSGSIYLLSTKEIHGFSNFLVGIATPIGGVFFIAGWLLLAISFRK